MKFKTFDSETCIPLRGAGIKTAAIGINFKTGLFRFNKEACEKIGLKPGNTVAFHQNEEEEADWFIQVGNPKGFLCRAKENVTSGVLFNNAALSKAIALPFNFEGKSANLKLGTEPIKIDKKTYWPIITGALAWTKEKEQ